MSPPLPALLAATGPSAIETVFDALLADIVRGTYPPGTRLPAERELSRLLDTSRPTLREALRRLSEWNLVVARRGSGILVREIREWTIEVLPAYLRFGPVASQPATLARFIGDLLLLRKNLMLDVVRMVRGRLPVGGTAAARTSAERAWAARHRGVEFLQHDFAVIRALVEAAELLPAMWTLNRIAAVYLDLAGTVAQAASPPDDYLAVYHGFLAKLDVADHASAEALLAAYLDRHDQRLLALVSPP